MNGTSNTGKTDTGPGEGGMDPLAAASLLERTQRQVQRDLSSRSPWLTLLAAAVVLVGFGAVWLSVRGQHPYTGPSAGSLVVLYVLLAIRIGSVVYAHRRASAGVSGHSVSQRWAEGAALGTAVVAVYLLMAALVQADPGQTGVYWVYAVTATLIVLGAFWSGVSAGMWRDTSACARSIKIPGRILPPGGSGVELLMSAISSAFRLTQAAWPSTRVR